MKFPEDKVRVINMRSMRTGWSKLLNQQEEVLVLTNRGKVVGFYVPVSTLKYVSEDLVKLFFVELHNIFVKKTIPQLSEVMQSEETEEVYEGIRGEDT